MAAAESRDLLDATILSLSDAIDKNEKTLADIVGSIHETEMAIRENNSRLERFKDERKDEIEYNLRKLDREIGYAEKEWQFLGKYIDENNEEIEELHRRKYELSEEHRQKIDGFQRRITELVEEFRQKETELKSKTEDMYSDVDLRELKDDYTLKIRLIEADMQTADVFFRHEVRGIEYLIELKKEDITKTRENMEDINRHKNDLETEYQRYQIMKERLDDKSIEIIRKLEDTIREQTESLRQLEIQKETIEQEIEILYDEYHSVQKKPRHNMVGGSKYTAKYLKYKAKYIRSKFT